MNKEVMNSIVRDSRSIVLPSFLDNMEYSERDELLIRFCVAAQRHYGNEPFCLSCREVGELLEVHYIVASKFLHALVIDEVLGLAVKGIGNRANQYRLLIEVD